MGKSRKPTKSKTTKPRGRNGMDSFSIYKFREAYKAMEVVDPDYGVHSEGILEYPQQPPIDLWYDKPYFGKYDLGGNSIYLLEKNIKQVPIKNSNNTILMVNFVADAFRDLQKHFAQGLVSSNISPTFELFKLPVNQAYVSPDALHQTYINKLFEVFILSYLEGNDLHGKINGFSDFMKHFNKFIRNSGQDLPFTFSGFLGSKRCPQNTCGLLIDLQSEGFSDDSKKIKDFLSKDSYSFFRNSAKNHGFMVDRNIPWRLVADVSSPKMREYMSRYDVTMNKDNFIKKYYAEAYTADIEIMLKNLVSFYNNYIESRPFNSRAHHAYSKGDVGTTKEVMKTFTRNKRRRKVNLKRIFSTYGLDDIIDFYFTIKCYETNAQGLIKDKANIVQEALNRKESLGISFGLAYLNRKITDHVKINLTIGTEYVKGNNTNAKRLLNSRGTPIEAESNKIVEREQATNITTTQPRRNNVISNDYS